MKFLDPVLPALVIKEQIISKNVKILAVLIDIIMQPYYYIIMTLVVDTAPMKTPFPLPALHPDGVGTGWGL